jgi:hypothetical protein
MPWIYFKWNSRSKQLVLIYATELLFKIYVGIDLWTRYFILYGVETNDR